LRSVAPICLVLVGLILFAAIGPVFADEATSKLPTGANVEKSRTIEWRLQSRDQGKPVERRESVDPRHVGVVAIDMWN